MKQTPMQSVPMHPSARVAVDEWDRWVAELEDHPLDLFECEALLATRDDVAELHEIAGSPGFWSRSDEVDVRFRDVTVDSDTSPVRAATRSGWWWRRVPSGDEALRYLGGEY